MVFDFWLRQGAQGVTMSVCPSGTSLSKALNLHLSSLLDLEADFKQTLGGFQVDFRRTSSGLQVDFKQTSRGLQVDIKWTLMGLQTDFK